MVTGASREYSGRVHGGRNSEANGSRVRAGYTLVEVIVAMTLLAVGLVGIVAMEGLAVRWLREAEAHSDAIEVAGTVLDSLLTVAVPEAGERTESRYQVRWATEPVGMMTRIDLEVAYHDGTAGRRVRFEMFHAPQPIRLRE